MDDCGKVNMLSSLPNGTNFSVGTPTTIILTEIVNGGHSIQHQFIVTIIDDVSPIAKCLRR